MMPLPLADIGAGYCIAKITGKDTLRHHLAEMGCVVGSPVVLLSEREGGVILAVKNTRLALDKTMASRIMVVKGEKHENLM